jgi:Tfp pilus assembly protein PilN
MRNIENSDWLSAPELGEIEAVGNGPGRASEFQVAARQVTGRQTDPEAAQ